MYETCTACSVRLHQMIQANVLVDSNTSITLAQDTVESLQRIMQLTSQILSPGATESISFQKHICVCIQMINFR